MGECWNLELEGKPDFEMAMKRIYAWYEQEIIDRPPIRFTAHNVDFNTLHETGGQQWSSLKERWFDAEYQVDFFLNSIKDQLLYAETFPIFWPNLGPEVYSAFYGSQLEYGEVTSWSKPLITDWEGPSHPKLDLSNEYFKKIEELTRLALEKCSGKFMVGYTDLHPGVDCAAAWRDPQQLCMDLILEPQRVKNLIELSISNFQEIFDRFDTTLKAHQQLSVTWMGIPSCGKLHIPSCDFAALISSEMFEEFCFPVLQNEVKALTHNIFHLDGKGVARHIDYILEVPEINAIQWVQGMGVDQPIIQWLPLLKKIRQAGKSIVVDLQLYELEEFIKNMNPEGVLLCIEARQEDQPDIIKRIEKWRFR